MKPKFSIFKSCNLLIFSFFILHLLFLVYSCRDKPTTPDNGNGVHVPKLKIEAEDVGVTDCFIRLKFLDTLDVSPKMFSLTRDGQTILSALCSKLDTLVLDEGLLPKHTYTYKAYRFTNNVIIDSSAELNVPTLDTTSSDFIFKIDTLGDGNSSVLRDVAIISDTCIWVVGEINCKDSLGNWLPMYNAARWDGNKWNKLRIPFIMNYGTSVFIDSTTPISSVYAPLSNDVWFCNGAVTRLVNNSWMKMNFLLSEGPGRANKIWGTSSNNMYFVADLGRITHYNGSSWRRLESGTDVDLTDVWGSPDGSVVWACGWEDFKPTILLRYQNGVCYKQYEDYEHRFQLRNDSLSGSLVSGMISGKYGFYLLSDAGLYKASSTTTGLAKRIPFPITWSGFPWKLRGNGVNDLIIVGEYFMLGHFNGLTFRHFYELQGYGRLISVNQKNNFVVAVGYLFDPIHSKGIVIRGRR